MSGIDEHFKTCIKQAISTLLDNGNCDPAIVRDFIRRETEKQLDALCGKAQGNDGRFTRYLKQQAESSLWNSKGDEEHDDSYYQIGAASCFFPVAARETGQGWNRGLPYRALLRTRRNGSATM